MDSRINNGICRCCASEGTFKDLATTYHWMGEEEIYAEMLKECFDIQLSAAEDSEQGGICEVCITQLRNASNFKKQVLHTEKQFKKRLQDKLFKSSIVKVEVPGPDDDALESDNDNNDDFSGTEYDVPIKEEEPADEPKPRKRAARATTSRAKKSKTERGETSTKRDYDKGGKVFHLLDSDPAFTKTSKDSKDLIKLFRNSKAESMCELQLHLLNLKKILRYSNATILQSCTEAGYSCFFCEQRFSDPADLKNHNMKDHINPKINFAKISLRNYLVKLDITELRCKLCDLNIDTVETLMQHLKAVHEYNLYVGLKNYLMSFKFDTDELKCAICSKKFKSFKILMVHMNSHNRNFVCNICDEGFVNHSRLSKHKIIHETGTFKCDTCSKVFDTLGKWRQHEAHVHKMIHKHRCRYCDETFKEHHYKKKHLVEKHGYTPEEFPCNACDKVFTRKVSFNLHMRRDHLLERPFQCMECPKNFSAKVGLENHRLTHLPMKMFQCELCKKSYTTKKSIKQHMKIHNDDRRWKCEHCLQAFVQKCSLKLHLKTKHNVIM
ncbi:zinc finger protein ZFP2 isoform X4 [Amyelois transitella]|uniref:zinc finger protein ZFP2 isoform X4 n=1 Tax=Amyelois transitella TaxID=680683 RepID=UPI00298F6169|nr:zinc finger protein ZFP2 isoform X4 [Amyelois transitella]